MAQHLNFFNTWGMEQECTLDPYAVRNAANREIAIHAAAPQAHHHALEWLEALAVPLNNFHLQAHCIARPDFR